MLAKAGESDRAIRVKMVRPRFFVLFLFSFRFRLQSVFPFAIGSAGRVPGWTETRWWKFSVFSVCPWGAKYDRSSLFFPISPNISSLGNGKRVRPIGDKDRLGSSRHSIYYYGASSVPVLVFTIISWHTICTPQRFHHTRLVLSNLKTYLHPRSLDRVNDMCATCTTTAAAIWYIVRSCIRRKKQTNKQIHKNRAMSTEMNKNVLNKINYRYSSFTATIEKRKELGGGGNHESFVRESPCDSVPWD
jgi:hypothetical protein